MPDTGLKVIWRVVIPLLPLLFFVAPGLWRNICPLAASNQTPRALGLHPGADAPKWLKEYGYVIASRLFVGFVGCARSGSTTAGRRARCCCSAR